MHYGFLSKYFVGAVAKRLTLVETVSARSNQREFQGIQLLRDLLGLEDRRKIPTRFMRLTDAGETLDETGFLSWSNVRKGKPRPPEYHMYYSANAVTQAMAVDDLLLIALQQDGNILCLIAPKDSSIESQLLWLFGLNVQAGRVEHVRHIDKDRDVELGFAALQVLEQLSIEVEEQQEQQLDTLIEPFGFTFPTTRIFSELARKSLEAVSARDDPDAALQMWLEREEQLFRRLERRIVAQRIEGGFNDGTGADVDGFIAFSLSVQNRRKSRVGHALENHLEAVFQAQGLRYSRGALTENGNKPDFLFPGAEAYQDASYPAEKLTMLGAKSTLKDRWRQVLSEAERIPEKHLLTLEPSLSVTQTAEMQAKQLQLVVPKGLHETYRTMQQDWLMDLASFIAMVQDRAPPNAPA